MSAFESAHLRIAPLADIEGSSLSHFLHSGVLRELPLSRPGWPPTGLELSFITHAVATILPKKEPRRLPEPHCMFPASDLLRPERKLNRLVTKYSIPWFRGEALPSPCHFLLHGYNALYLGNCGLHILASIRDLRAIGSLLLAIIAVKSIRVADSGGLCLSSVGHE